MNDQSVDDYRFITEDKDCAINLKTGHITDDSSLIRRLRRTGHHSLEWRGSLDINREVVDNVLRDVDEQILITARTYTFDKSKIDDTAQEIRLMVTDIVLKNVERDYNALVEFVRSCINNFARRVFRIMQKERNTVEYPAHSLLDGMFVQSSRYARRASTVLANSVPEHTYNPINELQWEELLEEVAQHLTPPQQRVFYMVAKNPDLTEAEVAEQLGYADQSGVSHILIRIRIKVAELIEEGTVDISH